MENKNENNLCNKVFTPIDTAATFHKLITQIYPIVWVTAAID